MIVVTEARVGDLRRRNNDYGCMYVITACQTSPHYCNVIYVCSCHLGKELRFMTTDYAATCELIARSDP